MYILEIIISEILILVCILSPVALMTYLMTFVLKVLKQDVQENVNRGSFDSIVIMLVKVAFFFMNFILISGLIGSTLGIFDEENAMITFLIPFFAVIIFLLILSVIVSLVKKWSHIKTLKNENDASRGNEEKD